MNYRSVSDLSDLIRNNIFKVPRNVDLIVGVPRSGMLAANILALNLNIKVCDINAFIANSIVTKGQTRSCLGDIKHAQDANHVLIVDDSICSGGSLKSVKDQLEKSGVTNKLSFCAIYALSKNVNQVDICFELVPMPRVFEWNLMHRQMLDHCCVDIDGVLCLDPTSEQNDDAENYINFLSSAQHITFPSMPIGHLVTSRLEKYRDETKKWLKESGIVYRKLHMLNLPDAEMRRRLNCHAKFKAKIYMGIADSVLFIESEPKQAAEIALLSGKPALCYGDQILYSPGMSVKSISYQANRYLARIKNKSKRILKRLIANG